MDNILPLDTYIPIYFETSFQNILEHATTTSQLNVPIKLAEKLGLGGSHRISNNFARFVWRFADPILISWKVIDTGKSLSEALILGSTNPQYD